MTIIPNAGRPRTPSLPDTNLPWFLLLLAAAFLIRMPVFGDPAYKLDEQFYLLAGDRMLHGMLPYVDLWDRKPVGLFLIYAGARTLGGAGFVQYQMLATLFAAGTAMCIFALARRFAGVGGATMGGLLYLLWIEIADGGGGQSPIFYNLPMAGAAALLIAPAAARPRWRAFAAMLLAGIAIQIKYTCVFEGLFFGLVATWQAWQRNRRAALIEVPLLALTALAPTFAAIGAYAALGHLQDFWFANFTSIFMRGKTPAGDIYRRIGYHALRLTMLTLCTGLSFAWLRRTENTAEARRWMGLMAGWCIAALIGFLSLGVLFAHYVLPVFVPFSAAAAPIWRRPRVGPTLLAIAALLPAATLHWPNFAKTSHSQQQMAALTALVPAGVSTGCMQMFDGPPILYHITHACMLSRYVFPDHLSAANEDGAIGVDTVAELKRVLALRPLVITTGDTDSRPPNLRTTAVLREALARDYRRAGHAPIGDQFISVWVRR
ncbi:hypothetical protein [Sphingomonas sp.]|uniref:ArnT family glycosyltransferase n=1 Tax=Sphingomonas sp. TaxID=28214 RepID=UPI0025F0090C|nr:hypothetical protein [Sphingomonas sp.]